MLGPSHASKVTTSSGGELVLSYTAILEGDEIKLTYQSETNRLQYSVLLPRNLWQNASNDIAAQPGNAPFLLNLSATTK